MDPSLNGNLITTKDAGEVSGYTPDYLARLVRSGKISGKKIGHGWFVDKESLTRFLDRQETRKSDYSRALARSREAEYRAYRSFSARVSRKLSSLQDAPLELVVSSLRSQVVAVSVAALVVGGAVFVAGTPLIPRSAFALDSFARVVAFGFEAGIQDQLARIEENMSFRNAPKTNGINGTYATVEIKDIPLPALFVPNLHARPIELAGGAKLASPSPSHELSPHDAQLLQDAILETFALLASPERLREVILNAPTDARNFGRDQFLAFGLEAYGTIEKIFLAYRTLVDLTGAEALALSAATRDSLAASPAAINRMNLAFGNAVIALAHTAIQADVAVSYGLAIAAPESARVTVSIAGALGNTLAGAAAEAPHIAARSSMAAANELALAGPYLARAVFDAEYALADRFIGATSFATDRYLALVNGTGRYASLASEAAGELASTLPHEVRLRVSSEQIARSDFASGLFKSVGRMLADTRGRGPALLENMSREVGEVRLVQPVAAVASQLSAGEKVALTTYQTINNFWNSATSGLAYLLSPAPVIVYSPVNSRQQTATSTRTKNAELGIRNNELGIRNQNLNSQFVIPNSSAPIHNSYPTYTTVVNGVSADYVSLSLNALKNDILSTVGGMIGPISKQTATNITTIQQVARIEKLDNLTINNGTFGGGTFDRSTLTNGISVAAAEGTFGRLTVTGGTTFSGNLVLASTTATAGAVLVNAQRFLHNYGTDNTFLGLDAGNFTMTGTQNTGIGANTLTANTTGLYNTAIGNLALNANTTGDYNTALGGYTLPVNTTGNQNTAVGLQVMSSNTTGSYNTALGSIALDANTTGTYNTAVGYQSAPANTTGTLNTALGWRALRLNTIGSGNTGIGTGAGWTNTTGTNNTLIGYNADVASSTLTNATALGYSAIVGASNSLVLGGTGAYAVNVGIGTSTPAWNLQVAGTRPSFALTDTSASADNKHWLFSSMGGNLYVGTTTDAYATSTPAALTILNNGRVGIGTTTPSAPLEIASRNNDNIVLSGSDEQYTIRPGSSSHYVAIFGGSEYSSGSAIYLVGNSDMGVPNQLGNLEFQLGAATSKFRFLGSPLVGTPDLVTILPSGNVGIGTTTPFSTLQVATTTGKNLVLTDSGASADQKHWLFSSMGGNLYVGTTTDAYATSTPAALTILNNGRVGVGTSSPASILSVNGASLLNGGVTIDGAGSGITFSGTGNHDISAAGGTLRIGSNTIIGNIQALDDTVDIGTPSVRFDKIYANEVNASSVVGTIVGGNVEAETLTINSDNTTSDQESGYLAFERGSTSPNATLAWNAATSSRRFEFNQPLYIQDASLTSATSTLFVQGWTGQTSDLFRIASSSDTVTPYLTVTAGGKVGIGTTSPSGLLDVYNSANLTTRFDSGSHNYLRLNRGASALNNEIEFQTEGTTNWALGLGDDSANNFYVTTNNAVPSSGAKVTITTGGNIGIGTTSPYRALSVVGNGVIRAASDSTQTFAVQNANQDNLFTVDTTGTGGAMSLYNGSAGAFSISGSGSTGNVTINNANTVGGDIDIQSRGASAIYVKGGGNVGIGTTSPYGLLTLYKADSTAANSPQLVFSASSTVSGVKGNFLNNWAIGTDIADGGKFKIASSSVIGTNDRFVIDGNGNVGIGTAGPGGHLHIYDGASGATPNGTLNRVVIEDNSNAGMSILTPNTSIGYYGFGDPEDAAVAYLSYDHSTNLMGFNVNAGTKMVINSSGNVGIGTTTSTSRLTLSNSGSALRIQNAVNDGLDFFQQTNNLWAIGGIPNQGIAWFDTSNSRFGIGSSTPGAVLSVSAGGTVPAFLLNQTSTGDLMTLQDSGSTVFTVKDGGNVGIGTTSPATTLSVAGNGYFTGGLGVGYSNTSAGTLRVGSASQSGSVVTFSGGSNNQVNIADSSNANYGLMLGSEASGATLDDYHGPLSSYLINVQNGPLHLGTNNASRLTILAAGNVGIGTTNPLAKLQIGDASNDGTVYIAGVLSGGITSTQDALRVMSYGSGAGPTGGIVWGGSVNSVISSITYGGRLSANSDGNIYIDNIYDTAASAMNFRTRTAGTAVNAMTILGSGNVGIGTTTPWGQLSASSTSAYPTLAIEQKSTGPAAVFLGGNVGIGTTSPDAVLDVVDTSSLLPSIIARNTSANNIVGLALMNDAPTQNSNSRNWGWFTNGNNYGQLDLVVSTDKYAIPAYNNTAIMSWQKSGNVGIGSTTPWGQLSASSTSAYPALVVEQKSTGPAAVFLGGNVGIGTAVPSALLHVSGDIFQYYSQQLRSGLDNTSIYGYLELYNGSTGDVTLQAHAANNRSVLINPNGGNVGIGTTTPTGKLAVTGSGASTGNALVVADSNNLQRFTILDNGIMLASGNASDRGNVYTSANSVNGQYDTDANGTLYINYTGYQAGTTQFRDTQISNGKAGNILFAQGSTGNVGIGDTGPDQKLEIQDDTNGSAYPLRITSGDTGWITGQEVGLEFSQTDTVTGRVTSHFDGSADWGINMYGYNGGLASAPGLSVRGTGRVGIGTTSPYSLLSISNAVTTTANTPLFTIASTTGGTATSTLMTVLASGNVGIGTMSPLGKLHVEGASPDFYLLDTASGINLKRLRMQVRAGYFYIEPINDSGAVNEADAFVLNHDAGYVGLGVTAATITDRLTIDGNVKVQVAGEFRYDQNHYFSPWTGSAVAVQSSGDPFVIYNTTEALRVSGGNVGIGTTSPSQLLSVHGNALISGNLTAAGVTATGTIAFTPAARTSGVTPYLTLTGAADTGLTASTEAPDVQFNLARTKTHANGNITLQRDYLINAATHAFTSYGAGLTTNLATLGITGAPLAGTNATTTNAHTLYLGASSLNASTTNSYGLTVNANTGATNNYAAAFLGGNVGIGTAAPLMKLDVTNGTQVTGNNSDNPTGLNVTSANQALTGGGATGYFVSNSAMAADAGGSIAFSGLRSTSDNASVLNFGIIKGAKENGTTGNYNGYLAFGTQNHNAGVIVERMRIDSSGNVGIGTTSPSSKLHVTMSQGTLTDTLDGATVAIFERSSAGQGANIQILGSDNSTILLGDLADVDVGKILYSHADNSMQFSTNGSEKVRITNGGNVGIGTTTPWGQLSASSTSAYPTLAIEQKSTGPAAVFLGGNVGIGTANPGYKLDVNGGINIQGTNSLTLNSASGASITQNAGTFQINSGAFPITFNFSSAEKVRFDNTGNIGIGTTSPNYTGYGAGNTVLTISGSGNAGGALEFVNRTDDANGTILGDIDFFAGQSAIRSVILRGINEGTTANNRGAAFTIWTKRDSDGNLSERMRVTNAGDIGIGTTSPSAKLSVKGGGATTGRAFALSNSSDVENFFIADNGWVSMSNDLKFGGNTNNGTITSGAIYNNSGQSIKLGSNSGVEFLNNSGNVEASVVMGLGLGTINASFRVSDAANASSPGFSFIGDTDTGIYSPAADMLGVVTGGTERMRINSSGYIGIGTTSPYSLLSISNAVTTTANTPLFTIASTTGGTSTSTLMTVLANGNVGIGSMAPAAPLHIKSSNGAIGFLLEQGDTSKPQWLGVGAANLATAGAVQIEVGVAGAANEFFSGTTQGDMVLKAYTQANNKKFFIGATDASSAEMVLQPNGNVGIGTTSPSDKLHVQSNGAGTVTMIKVDGDDGTADGGAGINFAYGSNSAKTWYIGQRNSTGNANDLAFGYGAADTVSYSSAFAKMVLTTTGNVGIGPTNPLTKLHVNSGSVYIQNTGKLIFGGNDNSILQDWQSINGDGSGNDLTLRTYRDFIFQTDTTNGAAGTNRLVIKQSTGNVGIGTTTPADISGGSAASLLQINGGVGTGVIEVTSNATANSSRIANLYFGTSGATAADKRSAMISSVLTADSATNVTGDLEFFTANNGVFAQQMTIAAGGNVGVGTSTPMGKLTVKVATSGLGVFDTAADDLILEGNGATGFSIINASANTSKIVMGSENDADGSTWSYNDTSLLTNFGSTRTGASLAFLSGNGVEAVRINSSGNVGIGTTSPMAALSVNSGQIVGAAGSLSAPTFSFTTDSDSGMFVNVDGVKIIKDGVTGLDVRSNTILAALQFAPSSDNAIQLGSWNQRWSDVFFARARPTSGTVSSPSYAFDDGSGNVDDTGMYRASADNLGLVTAGVERLRIDSSGNVGIGTTSPISYTGNERVLEVSGTSPVFVLSESDGTQNNKYWLQQANDERLSFSANGDVSTQTNWLQVERTGTTIDTVSFPNGNVGIGTTTPFDRFSTVNTSASASITNHLSTGGPRVGFGDVNTYNAYLEIGAYNSLNNIDTKSRDLRIFSTSDTTGITYKSTGNVGIGTTSPQNRLEIKVDSTSITNNALRLTNAVGQTVGTGIVFYADTNGASNTNVFNSGRIYSGFDRNLWSDARITLQTPTAADTWVDTLTAKNGNVGIGTSTPTSLLTIYDSNSAPTITLQGANNTPTASINFAGVNGVTVGAISHNINSGEFKIGSIAGSGHYLTFYEDNNERMRIDSSGNVGIGTTSPSGVFAVAGAGSTFGGQGANIAVFKNTSAAEDTALTIDSNPDYRSILRFYNGGTAKWGLFNEGPGSLAGTDSFGIYDYNDTTTRFVINQSGNVGIGTTTPNRLLTVGNPSTADVRANIVTTTNGIGYLTFSDTVDTRGVISYNHSSDSMFLGVPSNSQVVSIVEPGNVGIGTTSPWGLLSVNPNGISGPAFVVGSSTATSFVVTNGGNIGIGTAGPASKLHAVGGANGGAARFDADTNNLVMDLRNSSGTLFGEVVAAGGLLFDAENSNDIIFRGNDSERVRITNAGNVGIGTAAPTSGYRLDIQAAQAQSRLESTTGTNYAVHTYKNAAGNVYIGEENSTGGGLAVSSTAYAGIFTHEGAYPLQFGTNNTIRITIDSAGLVGIGTTSPMAALAINSGQLIVPTGTVSSPGLGFGNQANTGLYTNSAAGQLNIAIAGALEAQFSGAGTLSLLSNGARLLFGASQDIALTRTSNAGLNISGGNVGIGTTSPSQLLSVHGNALISGNLTAAGVTATGTIAFTPAARTSGVTPYLTLTGAADTGLTASTEAPDVQFNLARTKTHANGNITLQRDYLINAATHAFTSYGAGLTTNLATLGITGAPLAGTNATTTNAHTLYLGASSLNASTTNSYGLTVNANTGATNNYAAAFLGGNVGIGTTSPYAKLSVVGETVSQYFTATSTAATSTFSGGLAAASSLYVLQNGNVGIGTANPANRLEVQVSNTGPNFRLSSATDGATISQLFYTGSQQEAYIEADDGNLILGADGGNGVGYLTFLTRASGGSMTEQVRITNTGNVGIGTTSPYSLLTLYKAGSTAANSPQMVFSASSTVAGLNNALNNWAIGTDLADGGKFKIASSSVIGTNDRFVIDGNGYVGIGTASPNYKLDVNGDIAIANSSNLMWGGTGAYISGNHSSQILAFGTGSAEKVRITSTGKLGIGTTTPYTMLDIYSNSTAGDIYLGTSDFSGGGYNLLTLNGRTESGNYNFLSARTTDNSNLYINRPSGADILFRENNTDQVIIKTGGNVGIGTTSPKALAHISSAGNAGLTLSSDTYGSDVDASIFQNAYPYSTGGRTPGYKWITNHGSFGSRGIRMSFYDGITFYADNAEATADTGFTPTARMTLQNGGNLGIGTTSPGTLLSLGNTGNDTINISATATSTFGSGLNIRTGCFAINGVCVGGGSGSGTINSGTAGQMPYYLANGTTLTATSTLFLSSNQRVGVASSTPFAKLSVENTGTSLSFAVNDQAGDPTPFVVDASGNVGIGHASPTGYVDPFTNGSGGLLVYDNDSIATVRIYSTSNNAVLDLRAWDSGDISANNWQMYVDSTNGNLVFKEVNGNVTPIIAELGTASNTLYLDSTGNVGIGVDTTPDANLEVVGTFMVSATAAGNGNRLSVTSTGTGVGTTTPATLFEVGGATANVTFDGYKNCTGFTSNNNGLLACSASDQRLKQDITPLSNSEGLSAIEALQPVSFSWNPAAERSSQRQFGLIAQQVGSIFPNLVATSSPTALTPDGTLGINYEGLAAPMILAIQELNARGKELSDLASTTAIRVTSLKERIAALESGAVSSGSSSPISFSTTSLASAFNAFGAYIAKGIAQFGTLVADQFVAATNSEGTSSAGTVTILAGNTVAQVQNAYVKPTTKIFVTFTASTTGSWHIAEKKDGAFRLVLEQPQAGEVTFDYFLIQTEGQMATSSPATANSPSTSSGQESITILGDNPYRIEVGGNFVDPGVVGPSTDSTDSLQAGSGQAAPVTTYINGVEMPVGPGTIDTSSQTTYIITYRALTASGSVTATRSVIVGGGSVVAGTANSIEQIANSTDTGTGDSSQPAEADSSQQIVDSTAPTVTLNGAAAMQLSVGDTFTDQGATATDDTDGDVTAKIAVSGSVDAAVAGSYTLTYSATDAAGNVGSVSRLVTVVAPAAQ